MKLFFAVLAFCLVILVAGLGAVGLKIIRMPRPHDPLPAQIRARLDALSDTRHDIVWLVAKARLVGEGHKLPQEKDDYDELASDANAWLASVEEGVARNDVNPSALAGQYDERVVPKAKHLLETLGEKMRWMAPQRLDAGILKVATTQADHIITVLNYGWEDLDTYLRFSRANEPESKKLVIGELDDMKWVPWSEVMAEQF